MLLAPAAAAGLIVPGKSIRGVKLGMTQKQVRFLLGTPRKGVHGSNEFGSYTELRYATIEVSFQGETAVTNIATTSAADRTAGGIGVGSTKAAARKTFPGLRCEGRVCSLGRFLPGARVTSFWFTSAGRVGEVSVGLVID